MQMCKNEIPSMTLLRYGFITNKMNLGNDLASTSV